jgi:hypothetical protein
MKKEIIQKLASETNKPCVTISLNTHRTRPDNEKDRIVIKNMCNVTEKRLLKEFGKRDISRLLDKLKTIPDEIDISLNLESLHIFLSNDTKEIIRSSWPVHDDKIHITDRFALRPLIYALNRNEEYLILLLSQSSVSLFETLNDSIVKEITTEGFPFPENPYFLTDKARISDPKAVDNMVREFLNIVDKAIVKVYNKSGMQCIVICTEDNYSRLLQVADKPEVYLGYVRINYNNTAQHYISGQAWDFVKKIHSDRVAEALMEMKNAVPQGKVTTDLYEIYMAAKQGKGDMLVMSKDFYQAVRIKEGFSIELVDDPSLPGVIDDITSVIAWEVISKNGKVFFPTRDEMKSFGNIALKLRY